MQLLNLIMCSYLYTITSKIISQGKMSHCRLYPYGKFIYKALTLHDKEFLLKRDRSQSHKSAIYFQKCLPGKNMLELLSHS